MGLASTVRNPHECWMQKPRYNRRGSYSKAWHLVIDSIDSASLLVRKQPRSSLASPDPPRSSLALSPEPPF